VGLPRKGIQPIEVLPVEGKIVKRLIIALWVLVAAAAIGLAVLLTVPIFRPSPSQLQSEVPLGVPFQLTDHTGRVVTEKDFEGRPSAWFFGFTHCPDVCPTTLFQMSEHLKALGADGDKLKVVFVTVDPERDTVPVLRDYMSSFDPHISALTGKPEQISAMAKGFFVHFAKVPQKDDYTMEHSSTVLLRGKDGKFEGTLDMHEPVETQLQKLRVVTRDR
jgi:protein SCO1/2